MDDEEDDVFEPDSHCWRTAFREIKYEDRGTQTPSSVLPLPNNMLPCGVAQEPRLLFYGNAGFRLHFPAQFERVGDQGPLGERGGMERLNRQPQLPAHSIEVCIGQKLQLIGDQFHQEHLQVSTNGTFRGKGKHRVKDTLNTFSHRDYAEVTGLVSPKPKEHEALVVAPGLGSAHPAV
ncbi:bcl-2-modifying factor-like isoform X1 [Oncorhynchus clarkii lewisi]|uniref:bcl-2-modifying factor-like isoform X1 n=1 Tax=Oncorhynchus clarkii lewisi TaxID=490388 RepID=UPI0039B967FF